MNEFVDRLSKEFVKWGGGVDDDSNSDVHQRQMWSHLEVVGNRLKFNAQTLKRTLYYKDFLSYVARFWATGRGFYSAHIVRNIINDEGKALSKDEIQALKYLYRFLRTYLLDSDCVNSSEDNESVRKVTRRLKKSEFAKIDGMESLLDILGENGFIKAVIENSYFFSPRLVHSRFEDMVESINKSENLHARKSMQEDIYQKNEKNILFVDGSFKQPIVLDKGGNAEVRSIINATTGYTISQGKGSIFQNYCISHIWGRAFDPRYFTSLWNLVIVPAWGNSLMDKMADEESDEVEHLAAKLKSTIMAVCWKLYDMDNLDWACMGVKAPELISSIQLEPQTFSVRVLDGDMRILSKSIRV